MSDMTRREFAALVGGVGLLLAVKVRRARAQQGGKTRASDTSGLELRTTIHSARHSCARCGISVTSKDAILILNFVIMATTSIR
jgi:hypothetical protein